MAADFYGPEDASAPTSPLSSVLMKLGKLAEADGDCCLENAAVLSLHLDAENGKKVDYFQS